MSNFVLIDKLKKLLDLQQQKSELQTKLTDLLTATEKVNAQQDRLNKVMKNEKQNLFQTGKDVSLYQEELNAVMQDEKSRRAQLDEEKNSNTLHMLSIAVRNLELRRKKLENDLENNWQEMQRSEKNLAIIEKQAEIKSVEFANQLNELNAQQQALTEQLQTHEAELEATLNTLPDALKAQISSTYERSKVIAIAKIINTMCSNCFYPLTNRDLAAMKNPAPDQIFSCKNCFTILYLDE